MKKRSSVLIPFLKDPRTQYFPFAATKTCFSRSKIIWKNSNLRVSGGLQIVNNNKHPCHGEEQQDFNVPPHRVTVHLKCLKDNQHLSHVTSTFVAAAILKIAATFDIVFLQLLQVLVGLSTALFYFHAILTRTVDDCPVLDHFVSRRSSSPVQ